MDLDRSNSVELEKRDHIHSSQTILKTPEKPPSPIYNYRQNHVTTVLLAGKLVCSTKAYIVEPPRMVTSK